MDVPHPSGDTLAQPTRARVFAELSELRRPAGTDEIAVRLGLHPNGVRVHLERMRRAGLVARERTRQPIGRPRDMWSIAANAQPGGRPPSAYVDLGRWLALLTSHSRTSVRAIEATGREIGRSLAPEGGTGSSEERMYGVLASLGFAPQREVDPASHALTYRLGNCPYRDVARQNQEVVCTLHRGVTRGLLDALAPTTKLAAFVARDPDAGGCLIELRGDLASEAVARAAPTAAGPR